MMIFYHRNLRRPFAVHKYFYTNVVKLVLCLLMLQFYLVSNCYANSSALEGGVINFQGLLVNEKGVPYGTNTPETFIMRFSITSRIPTSFLGTVIRLKLKSLMGYSPVRLGKFDENVEALDSSIFTVTMIEAEEDFSEMEVCTSNNLRDCTPYNARNYRGFFQKDSNQNFSPTVVDSQIPVPGGPFRSFCSKSCGRRYQRRNIKD